MTHLHIQLTYLRDAFFVFSKPDGSIATCREARNPINQEYTLCGRSAISACTGARWRSVPHQLRGWTGRSQVAVPPFALTPRQLLDWGSGNLVWHSCQQPVTVSIPVEGNTFSVQLKLLENYLFQIDFGEFGNLLTDEPEPLGDGEGPSPSALLAASVANCLSVSLLFALRKFKEEPGEVTATITGTIDRVGKFRRITGFKVALQLGVEQTQLPSLAKVLAQFENFCTVTQSVKRGIPVEIEVFDSLGNRVHHSAADNP